MNHSRLAVAFAALYLPLAAHAQPPITGERAPVQQKAVVNFSELAGQRTVATAPTVPHRPLRPDFKLRLPPALEPSVVSVAGVGVTLALMPSPPVTQNFLALLDDGTTIPPDTMGAVGPNHVMTMLNSQLRIQSRSGANVSTVSLNSFWASLGNPDTFDPHVTYDSFNNRWILSSSADSDSPAASILVGVSATSDPTGNWFLFRTDIDAAGLVWGDFDQLGFNRNWVVVTANIFRNRGGLEGVWVWAYDKADLYANGTGTATLLKFVENDPDFFTFSVTPAQMHDNTLDTMYLVEDWDDSAGQLRISTITGPVGAEVLTSGTSFPTSASNWAFFGGDDFSPQFGSTRGIDAGDSRILSCSYRNGSLWATHTTFLPATKPTHAVAQWWQVSTNGTVQQFGRIEDLSGSRFYAYPSIAVNANNDVLVGYSRFSKSQFASANYSFRFATDPANTLRQDTVFKAGEASYFASDGSLNRWGDYSATCVDPLNDLTMWTIQEYAAGPVDTWGTWWARIDPDLSALKLLLTSPADGISYPANPTVTLTATRFDTNTALTKVEFFADGVKVGETNAEPYTILWSGAGNGSHSIFAIGTETGGGVSTSVVALITVGDLASPIGIWEIKISGGAKGNGVLTFNDDFTVTEHSMTLGFFGLLTDTGTWSFDQDHHTVIDYGGIFGGIFSNNFVAKVTAGKKISATNPMGFKFKGTPLRPATDLSGNWSATVKVGTQTTMESYVITPSPTFLNVFDFNGSATGMILETSKGKINLTTESRSLAGSAKALSFTAKGMDNGGMPVSIKATKP